MRMENRIDRLTAVYVDLAYNVAAIYGMYAGVCFLHAHFVHLSVVRRVILELGPRRGDGALSDWQRTTLARPELSSHDVPRIPRNDGADQ